MSNLEEQNLKSKKQVEDSITVSKLNTQDLPESILRSLDITRPLKSNSKKEARPPVSTVMCPW